MMGKGKKTAKERQGLAGPVAGADKKMREVKFQAMAPDGSAVFLAGSFNNWDPEALALSHNGDGVYERTVQLPAGRHEYKYVINGVWRIDAQCKQWMPNSLGSLNSVVEVV
jgi:1,4-alpha-glucan branching enzyme